MCIRDSPVPAQLRKAPGTAAPGGHGAYGAVQLQPCLLYTSKSNVAAFVTLPGVKDSLSGLLPDELDTIEDYLQDRCV